MWVSWEKGATFVFMFTYSPVLLIIIKWKNDFRRFLAFRLRGLGPTGKFLLVQTQSYQNRNRSMYGQIPSYT